jgi:hypothetical protein
LCDSEVDREGTGVVTIENIYKEHDSQSDGDRDAEQRIGSSAA